MPINATYEFDIAQKKVEEARTPEEKIKALQEALQVAPSHKGAEKLRLNIKSKISKLKKQIEKSKVKKGSSHATTIKREGAAQIALVGMTNTGKSTILNELTNANARVEHFEFTTKKPIVGALNYRGIVIQIIEIPAIVKGYYESDTGPSYISIARNCNLMVLLIDGTKPIKYQIDTITNEFEKAGLSLTNKKSLIAQKTIIIVNKKVRKVRNTKLRTYKAERIADIMWENLDLIYVFTKTPTKSREYPPVALKKGSTVKDLAEQVHKDFIRRFKFARVWGNSVKHDGTQVGLDFKLKQGDTVEFHMI